MAQPTAKGGPQLPTAPTAPTEGRRLLPRVQETLGKSRLRLHRSWGEARLETLGY